MFLKKEADRRNEGIAKTANYFNCLPSTINYELGETNIAEIRFQNQTNVYFHIKITGVNSWNQRSLITSGSCGDFEIRNVLASKNPQCDIIIHIQDFDDYQSPLLGQAHNLIEEDSKLLIGGQIHYINQTNHTK
jgi:hypothetical protein